MKLNALVNVSGLKSTKMTLYPFVSGLYKRLFVQIYCSVEKYWIKSCFFYYGKHWNGRNVHLQMWKLFAIWCGTLFAIWCEKLFCQEINIAGWYPNGKRFSRSNVKKNHICKWIFFDISTFVIIEEIASDTIIFCQCLVLFAHCPVLNNH